MGLRVSQTVSVPGLCISSGIRVALAAGPSGRAGFVSAGHTSFACGDGRLRSSSLGWIDAIYDPVEDFTYVPEPGTLGLLALGGLALARRRSR